MENLYAILLKKNLRKIDGKFNDSWISKNCDYTHWIALGHFDDIYTYSLNDANKNFFALMQDDKKLVLEHNNEQEYYHPLYLVSDKKNYISDGDVRFIAIVRIHFSKSYSLATQFKNIEKSISEKLNSFNFTYQFYYATEFSDMVLDIRSKHLDELLDTVLRFREIKNIEIGKMYTYFGINLEFLSSMNFSSEDDEIPLFSMRFSGYNMGIVKEQLKLIKKHLDEDGIEQPEYCINGIDDIMLIYRNCKTNKIINLYRDWLFNCDNEDCRKSESSTRFGVEINVETTDNNIFQQDSEIMELKTCQDLPNICKEISSLISTNCNESYFGWFHAISEIANSLVTMSKTPVMDEVVYLIAPGVRTFLLNVREYICKDVINFSYCNRLYDFVESCSYYIEQLMRIEGQLSHNPEFRPVIYNIPIFMLEYTISFLNKISKILQHEDVGIEKQNTVFLLVPRPCERASAIEIFPATNKQSGLVHIQIPENILYTPTDMLRALCHEISHYVGERFRNREKRKKYYATAMASLLIERVFDTKDLLLLKMFKNFFLKEIQEYPSPTIREMYNKITNSTQDMLLKNDAMNNIMKLYFAYADSKNELPSNINFISDEAIEHLFVFNFRLNAKNINILFREVFADICMIYILDISTKNYIESLLQEIELYPNDNSVSDEAFAIRIYTTLAAMDRKIEYTGDAYERSWEKVKTIIEKINEEIDMKINGKYGLIFSPNIVYALLNYSKECYRDISQSLNESDVVEVRKMYANLSNSNLQYKDILNEIEEYRKILDE